jgi:UPF0755 protein
MYELDKTKKTALYVIGSFIFFLLFYFLFLSPPADFQAPIVVRIEQGMSLRSASLLLEREHIIRSRIAFEAFIIIFGREKHVIQADYYFESKLPVYEVARRIGKGEHDMAPVVVTIPEGFDTAQTGEVFASKLLNFDKTKFASETKGLEGYLFPDTYFFLSTDTETDVIKSMSENFKKKMLPLKPDIISSGKKEKEIIIMASIIEREAKGDADRAVISGILWRRLKVGMPLQVDAAPETYKTKGLPKNPISNPGIEAIKAAIYPQNSPYLYYLHDREGGIHYARSYSEHIKNKLKYLQ